MHGDSTITAADTAALDALERAVEARLGERYGTPVLRRTEARVQVLPGKPLALARECVAELGIDAGLLAPIDVATLPWFSVPAGGLELWRTHGSTEELVTQVVEGDPPLQQVCDYAGHHLVRAADGATGWVPAATFEEVAAPQLDDAHAVDVEAFVTAVESFLGTTYVWGGTLTSGVDCSGLVQRAAWISSRVWLPRHSTELLRVGKRVSPTKVQRGDVLVLRRNANVSDPGHHHVAVALSGEEAIHASRDQWQVLREDLAPMRERYDVIGVRRFGVVDA